MKHSEQLGEAIRAAAKAQIAWNTPEAGDPGTIETLTAAIYGNTAALLEIARQIAITREEAPGPLPIMAAIVASRRDHIMDLEEAVNDAAEILIQAEAVIPHRPELNQPGEPGCICLECLDRLKHGLSPLT